MHVCRARIVYLCCRAITTLFVAIVIYLANGLHTIEKAPPFSRVGHSILARCNHYVHALRQQIIGIDFRKEYSLCTAVRSRKSTLYAVYYTYQTFIVVVIVFSLCFHSSLCVFVVCILRLTTAYVLMWWLCLSHTASWSARYFLHDIVVHFMRRTDFGCLVSVTNSRLNHIFNWVKIIFLWFQEIFALIWCRHLETLFSVHWYHCEYFTNLTLN